MTWELYLGLGVGGVGLVAALGATVYALVSVRDAMASVRAAQVELAYEQNLATGERTLRMRAEMERDRALAAEIRMAIELDAARASGTVAVEAADAAAVTDAQEVTDATLDPDLVRADAALDDLVRG